MAVPRSLTRQQRARVIGRGERVFVRTPRPADEREFTELRRLSWSFLEPWEPRIEGVDPLGSEMFVRYLHAGLRTRRMRLLVCHNHDGALLGSISIGDIERGSRATLGYWIGAPYARRGYMSEALPLAVAHAFERFRLTSVEAYVLPENTASRALLSKLGFRVDGVVRSYRVLRGEQRDHERWTLSAPELAAPSLNDPSRAGNGSPG
jgi:ribosomal-protein-alanine N-acetyltransferase